MECLDGRRHAAALGKRDGRELFYVAPDGALMAVSVDPRGGCGAREDRRRFCKDRTRQGARETDV